MWRWLAAIGGAGLGAAAGLFGPVFLFRALSIGSGSYEDVLVPWLFAVPTGIALGAWLAFRWVSRRS